MIKTSIIILSALLSCLCVQAQTIVKEQIKEETLPDGSLVRVHVSGRNGDSAAVLQRSDGYWVYIKQTLYGPFETTDALTDSPFESGSGVWQFRGQQEGRAVLIINGVRYGSFDHVWTANVSKDGNHWGALIKNGGRYAVIVDGRTTDYFDIIFQRSQAGSLSLEERSFSSAPFFYGSSDKWVAIGYRAAVPASNREAEFRVVTGAGEGPRYDQVEEPDTLVISDPDNLDYGVVRYYEFLTSDKEHFVVSVHQPTVAAGANHLWINERTYGPYPGGRTTKSSNFFPTINMADDGSDWMILGSDTVYTKTSVLQKEDPQDAAISDNGKVVSFSFLRNGQSYVYVGGRELGPYKITNFVRFSPSGDHWLVAGRHEDGVVRFTTESGAIYGSYKEPSRVLYPTETLWTGFSADLNETGWAVVNGAKTAGPFDFVYSLPVSDSIIDYHTSVVVGYKGDVATLIINGVVVFQQSGVKTGGWRNVIVSEDGARWGMVSSNVNGTSSFIDNGRVLNGLAAPRVVALVPTENAKRVAFIFTYQNISQQFLVNGASYGPYNNIGDTTLSSTGSSWVFSAAGNSGRLLVLPGTNPVEYDLIAEVKSVSGEDAVIYNGFRNNRWSPGVNTTSLGSYTQASIACSAGGAPSIYLAVNEGDRKVKTYKVSIQR